MPGSEETLRIILDNITPLGVERVDLQSALGRVLARDVGAPWDLPLFDNSARDGFALRSADCTGEGTTLRITGFIPAGCNVSEPVLGGCAVRIMTGAPIPHNCDAVVPVEDTLETDGLVTVMAPVRRRQHIRFRGEDLTGGDLVLTEGTVIQAQEIGLLASFGQAVVPVYRKARVAVLSTGDELIELGEQPSNGRIINSNAQYLAAALREIGAEPILLCIGRDNRESLKEQLQTGLKADALITTAGVSAGARDLVRDVLAEVGVRQMLGKIDMKSGGPKAFGMKDGIPVFSLPGNPLSTMVTFEEFVRPGLLRLMGHRRTVRPYLKARLREDIRKEPGRVHCQSVRVEAENGRYMATTVGNHKACRLSTIQRANAIVILPEGPSVVAAGEEVEVHLLRGDLVLLEEPNLTAGCVPDDRVPKEGETFERRVRVATR